jgi:hypothetical protein
MMKFFKMNLLLASLLLLIGCCLLIRVQAEEGDLDVMEPMAGEEQQPRLSSDYITQYPAPSGVIGGYTPQHVDHHQHLQQTMNEEEPKPVHSEPVVIGWLNFVAQSNLIGMGWKLMYIFYVNVE